MADVINLAELRVTDALSQRIATLGVELSSLATRDDAASMARFRVLNDERTALIKQRDQEIRREKASGRFELSPDERAQRDADIAAVKDDLRAWLQTRDYYYVQSTERFWLHKPATGEWIMSSERALKNDRRSLNDRLEFDLLLEVMREDGRYKDTLTYSFAEQADDVLNLLRVNFVGPLDDGQAPHWIFDTVIRSIGGDKAENIEHIEKLVLAKYLHPEDITLPALVLQDDGGTGKSLFVSVLLGTLFGHRFIADNLSMADLVGKFNSRLEGKVVWFVNESAKGTYSLDDLKRKLGSSTFSIERKGIDSISVPMIAWMVISGNDLAGSVLLSNNDTDRRYSVVKGGAPLSAYVAPTLDCSRAEAVKWVKDTGSKILGDPSEVGRWVNAMIKKHGDPGSVDGLHGEDYAALAETQKSIEEAVLEAVFLRSDFDYIRRPVLYDFYRAECRRQGRNARRDRVFFATAVKWLAEHQPDIVRTQANIGHGKRVTSSHIFHRANPLDVSTPRVELNDDRWFESDSVTGRKTWLIEVE
nr:DUF5906 domain-containing protein [Novosphingobium panipatense]